ncbi:hypothetical protein GJ688_16195 [Heliobacillus mobilis]|uniref:Uncharacterized protein n=1 Tax=Heliobacterium mobile TaxID=28064 RepID=A0A6I3SNK7_HELMO|nr:hypothetical protein [Heliobacterium mobile]MTV50489.1 hypothetical protein [Heliobacterium mobile]
MNRLKTLFLFTIILSLLLSGCRSTPTSPVETDEETGGGPVPVLVGAILAPADSATATLNPKVTEAVRSVKTRLGVHKQIVTTSDFLSTEEALRYFGENEARVVLIADPAYKDILPSAEQTYPKTKFLSLTPGDVQTGSNRLAGAYLVGALAGAISPNGAITALFTAGDTQVAVVEKALRTGLAETNKKAVLTRAVTGENIPLTGDVLISTVKDTLPVMTASLTGTNVGIALVNANEPTPSGIFVVESGYLDTDILPQLESILSGKDVKNLGKTGWNLYIAGPGTTPSGPAVKRPLSSEINEKMMPLLQKVEQGQIDLAGF